MLGHRARTVELVVLLLLIAAVSQWISHRSKPIIEPAASRAPASRVDDYDISGLYLGMTEPEVNNVLRPAGSEVGRRFDADGHLCWVKGPRFSCIVQKAGVATDRRIEIVKGSPRSLVLQTLGPPVAYDDNVDRKWGYWTNGLPNRDMGILFEFRDDRVESIEMASRWAELAAHLTDSPTTPPESRGEVDIGKPTPKGYNPSRQSHPPQSGHKVYSR